MLRFLKYVLPALLVVLVLLPCSVLAAQEITADSVYVSSRGEDPFHEDHLNDGSGLEFDAVLNKDKHDSEASNMWRSAPFDNSAVFMKDGLKFDFDKMYRISAIELWQYNNGDTDADLNIGAKKILIEGSISGFTKVDITETTLERADQVRDGEKKVPVHEVDISAMKVDTWLIQLVIDSNYGGAFNGLSEVRIWGDPAPDSDGDGMADVWEWKYAYGQYHTDEKWDPDADWSANPQWNLEKDVDSDGDGISNYDEYIAHSDPTNTVPDKPELLAPEDGATGISLIPTLQAGDFSDPDDKSLHLSVWWQVSRDETFMDQSKMVYDFFKEPIFKTLPLTKGFVEPETEYFWRVSYFDNKNEGSPWSDTYSFTTAPADDPINKPPAGSDDIGGASGGCFLGSLF